MATDSIVRYSSQNPIVRIMSSILPLLTISIAYTALVLANNTLPKRTSISALKLAEKNFKDLGVQ